MHAVTTRDLRSAILNAAGGRQRCWIVLLLTKLGEVVQIESYPNRTLLNQQPRELCAAALYTPSYWPLKLVTWM